MATVPNRLYAARSPEGVELWIPESEMPGSGGASGDVVGPASSTANGFAIWNGTTGKLLKDSGTAQAQVLAILAGAHVELPNLALTAPGTYTLANSGMVWKNADGDEIGRLWFTDPNDVDNYNSGNLYLGLEAGLNQPTDNVTAGYRNTGIGHRALMAVTTGFDNYALGFEALKALTEGSDNQAIGYQAGSGITTGSSNVSIGNSAGNETTTADDNTSLGAGAGSTGNKANTTCVGRHAVATLDNQAVFGNPTTATTLLYGDITVAGTTRVLATGASHTVDQVITLLQTIGLCKQS